MKHTTTLTAFSLALAALITPPCFAVDTAGNDADQVLRAMSEKLAAAKQFSFTAQRKIDAALLDDRDLPEKARIVVKVSRSNQFAARSVSKAGARQVIADGKTLVVIDEKMNHYAQVPMQTSLDGLVARLDEKFGFTPPLAEFVLSNVYADIRKQGLAFSYRGRGKLGGFLGLGGVECHRIGLAGKLADVELWIAASDSLPRKLTATFREPGNPQLRIIFSNWNLAAPLSAADFTFNPPAGAEKIEMWTEAQMQAAYNN